MVTHPAHANTYCGNSIVPSHTLALRARFVRHRSTSTMIFSGGTQQETVRGLSEPSKAVFSKYWWRYLCERSSLHIFYGHTTVVLLKVKLHHARLSPKCVNNAACSMKIGNSKCTVRPVFSSKRGAEGSFASVMKEIHGARWTLVGQGRDPRKKGRGSLLTEAADNLAVGRYAIREATNVNQQQTPGTAPRYLSPPPPGHVHVRQDSSGRAEVTPIALGEATADGCGYAITRGGGGGCCRGGDGEHSAVFVVLSQPSASFRTRVHLRRQGVLIMTPKEETAALSP